MAAWDKYLQRNHQDDADKSFQTVLVRSALGCDLLIATATPREYTAVKHAIAEGKGKCVSNTGAGSTFKIANRRVVAVCLGQSPQTFGIRLTKCLLRIQPQYAVLVGVCGSDGGESVIDSSGVGKVLVVDQAFNYERGKHERKDDDAYVFRPDFKWHEGKMTREDLGLFIEEHRQDSKYGMYKDVVAMACGAAIRSDKPKVLEEARRHQNRSCLGLDMESAAFFEACQHCDIKSLGVFKAVLDLMDSEKGVRDETYGRAAGRAADTALAFYLWLDKGLTNSGIDVGETTAPPPVEFDIDEWASHGIPIFSKIAGLGETPTQEGLESLEDALKIYLVQISLDNQLMMKFGSSEKGKDRGKK